MMLGLALLILIVGVSSGTQGASGGLLKDDCINEFQNNCLALQPSNLNCPGWSLLSCILEVSGTTGHVLNAAGCATNSPHLIPNSGLAEFEEFSDDESEMLSFSVFAYEKVDDVESIVLTQEESYMRVILMTKADHEYNCLIRTGNAGCFLPEEPQHEQNGTRVRFVKLIDC